MLLFREGACGRLFLLLRGLGSWLTILGLTITGLTILAAMMPVSAIARETAWTCPTSHYDESAAVSSVHDGDTVRLEDGRKIRLIGINAPELARSNKPEQAFAADARNQLKQFIISSDKQIRLVYGKERLDRYQRTLAHLFLPDGRNLQATLLRRGLATASAYPPNVAFSNCYQQAEQVAKCKLSGIWSDENYATKESAALEPDTQGFHIVSGQVERVSESGKGLWLFLQGGLMIGIRTADLPNFDRDELKSLAHQKITVRGWLYPKKKAKKGVKFYMRLRHPSAITPAATTGNIAKC